MPAPDAFQLILLGLITLVAGTLAAVAGFGGAALLLPLLAVIFGMRNAVPILTVAQLIGNGSRVWFNRHDLVYPVVGWFALGAVPFALLGGFMLASAPLPALTRLLGLFLLLSVAWRHLHKTTRPLSLRGFAIIGAAASFLSALLGSVGPLMAPFFLAYGLVKGAYIGTEALSTVVMHITKLVAYNRVDLLSDASVIIGLALGAVLMLGSYIGKRLLERLPEHLFTLLIELVLIISGLNFLISG